METPRADAWYADLTEEQLWQLYAIAKRTHNWAEVARIARDELHIEAEISRSAFYRWRDWMRQQDADRRRVSIIAAQQEAIDIAQAHGIKDDAAINALKSLAIDAAMRDDSSEALKWVNAAMSIKDRQQKAAEIALKKAKGDRDDRALALAREKFEAAERRENAARSALGDTKLTDADKIAKIKEIFG